MSNELENVCENFNFDDALKEYLEITKDLYGVLENIRATQCLRDDFKSYIPSILEKHKSFNQKHAERNLFFKSTGYKMDEKKIVNSKATQEKVILVEDDLKELIKITWNMYWALDIINEMQCLRNDLRSYVPHILKKYKGFHQSHIACNSFFSSTI